MKNFGSHAFFFAKNSEQQVFGADVAMVQPLGLLRSVRKNPLALVRKRQIDRGGHLLTNCSSTFDFLADTFNRGVVSQESVRQILVFADQAKQQMLGLDGRTAKLTGFVSSEEDHPPCSFSVSFEHIFMILSSAACPCGPLHWNFRTTTSCNPATTSILRLFLILNEELSSNNNFIRNFRNRDGERRLYRPIFGKFLRRVPKPRHIGPQFAHYGYRSRKSGLFRHAVPGSCGKPHPPCDGPDCPLARPPRVAPDCQPTPWRSRRAAALRRKVRQPYG